ncbi:hypothetical protein D3C73_1629940 [compost metagenome]
MLHHKTVIGLRGPGNLPDDRIDVLHQKVDIALAGGGNRSIIGDGYLRVPAGI